MMLGRSREGAWIEISLPQHRLYVLQGRSREGAWIEICVDVELLSGKPVAPVRERGLKSL